MCTKFSVDSTSYFSFRVRTCTHTHSLRCHWLLHTHWLLLAWVISLYAVSFGLQPKATTVITFGEISVTDKSNYLLLVLLSVSTKTKIPAFIRLLWMNNFSRGNLLHTQSQTNLHIMVQFVVRCSKVTAVSKCPFMPFSYLNVYQSWYVLSSSQGSAGHPMPLVPSCTSCFCWLLCAFMNHNYIYRVGHKKPSPYMSANYVFQE